MAQGLTPQRQAFVAAYIGDARGNASEAARIAGYRYPGQEGHRLLKIAEIDHAIQEWRAEVKQRGIASLEYRLDRLDDMDRRYWQVVAERADQYRDDPKAAGGGTGFIVKTYKMVGGGENAMLVEEYVADTAVTKEIRAIYDDAAKELGQRVDKINVAGNLTREYVIVRPGENDADVRRDVAEALS